MNEGSSTTDPRSVEAMSALLRRLSAPALARLAVPGSPAGDDAAADREAGAAGLDATVADLLAPQVMAELRRQDAEQDERLRGVTRRVEASAMVATEAIRQAHGELARGLRTVEERTARIERSLQRPADARRPRRGGWRLAGLVLLWLASVAAAAAAGALYGEPLLALVRTLPA